MELQMGYVILAGDILLRILPVLILFILSTNLSYAVKQGFQKLFLTGCFFLAAVVCFLFYLFLHRILLQHWNFTETVRAVIDLEFSYQDIAYFLISVLICTIFAFVAGEIFKNAALLFFSGKCTGRSLSSGRKAGLLLALAATGLVVIGSYSYMLQSADKIVINEVCSNNQLFTFENEDITPDYIEIYNSGPLAFEAERLYLSDDRQNLQKTEITSDIIPAGDFLVVELGNSAFALRKTGGETVFLSDARGNIIDQVSLEATDPNYAYARQEDGGEKWGFFTCTPGISNLYADRQVAAPVFSHESGFYSESFALTLSSEPNTVIYYTLDGSIPSDNAELYTGELLVYDKSSEENIFRSIQNVVRDWPDYEPDKTPVDKAFIIRAVAVDENGNYSKTVTATYFINMEEYQQNIVLSLVAEPKDLFGEDGIYVSGQEYDEWYLGGQAGEAPDENYEKRGKDFEIEASMEYFSRDKSFSQLVGMRVAGASTRYELPLKYFNLYARKEYSDSNTFDRNFFDHTASHKVNLRYGHSNVLCQTLVSDRNIATQRAVRASVFLNGEFWYRGCIMEKYDSRFFETHYGISKENLIVIKEADVEEGLEDDINYYNELYNYLRHNSLEEDSNYQKLCKQIDLQSFIDFMCINLYIDNLDFTDSKNVVMWRSRDIGDSDYADTKWRWALYDLDAMEWDDASLWGYKSQAEKNSFSITPQFVPKISEQTLYSCLRKNPDFCQRFVLTFMDLVNTDFKYDNVEPKLNQYFYADGSETSERQYFEEFFRNRADNIVPYMAEEFGLKGTLETVTLDSNFPDAGSITLNTITPDLSEGEWSGKYYTDYPVTATAEARYGYEFVGWEGAVVSKEASIEVPVEVGGIELHAIFRKSK